MSYQDCVAPKCTMTSGVIELRVESKPKDLGELTVRRVLPSAKRRMIGPFVFFDHMGPAEFEPGKGIQVRPHPHIGIATITYLFEGEILHRDSLGVTQPIRAGAVNLMTAGKGIVHSERAGSDLDEHSVLHGIQSWMALPAADAEMDPAFEHYPADQLPGVDVDGVQVCVIIGQAYGRQSPVSVRSTMLYLECKLPKGSALTLPEDYQELGAYVVSGLIRIDGNDYVPGVLAVAAPGKSVVLSAVEESRVMVIGGESLGERQLWWNFVASSQDRINQAKADWQAGRFGQVPGDAEFIPLPEK